MRMKFLYAIIAGTLVVGWGLLASAAEYGVDCSFPIHHFDFRCGNILGNRKKFYEDFMQGKVGES